MIKSIDFYFDVISPYAFIAHEKIKRIVNKNKIIFNYKPILLGGLHNLQNIIPPAFNKHKMKNMINDCNLISKKNDIEFKWNNNFPINSLSIMRGYLFVNHNEKKEYLDNFFCAYWKNNIDLSNVKNFELILKDLDIDINYFFKEIKNEKIKDQLKHLTNEAFNKEVFGTPTFIANNKIFWGQDRLEYAVDEMLI